MSKRPPRASSDQMARRVVAGLVLARCACCREAQELVPHADLDATRLLCPASGQVYLDRGDGVFEIEVGRHVAGGAASAASARAAEVDDPEVLSDRPRRTADKARISLERATFAEKRR